MSDVSETKTELKREAQLETAVRHSTMIFRKGGSKNWRISTLKPSLKAVLEYLKYEMPLFLLGEKGFRKRRERVGEGNPVIIERQT